MGYVKAAKVLVKARMPSPTPPFTSFAPGELWPDNNGVHINAHGGGILLHDGIFHWFGEHKVAGKAGNVAMVGVSCYTSRDLYNWSDAGIALAVSDEPASDLVRGCVIERPKVIYNPRTRRFVMWFHLELKGQGYAAARVGVAESERAIGPYRFLRSFRPNAGDWPLNVPEEQKRPLDEGETAAMARLPFTGASFPAYPGTFRRDVAGGQMSRDMTLFVDDDGAAYHVRSSEENGTLHIALLSDDFLGTAGPYVRVLPGRFNEGPALFKRAGRYYLIASDCTGWAPNAARSAVADSIWGPWSELGNPCEGSAEQVATTFASQSTYVLKLPDRADAYIYLGDRWRPDDARDGRYVWLPLRFDDGRPRLAWRERWDLSVF